jgi:hypothetical protein
MASQDLGAASEAGKLDFYLKMPAHGLSLPRAGGVDAQHPGTVGVCVNLWKQERGPAKIDVEISFKQFAPGQNA